MSLLEVSGVSKSFGRLRVLRDISLRIEEGEAIALLGPSGCGKTTLLRVLLGLESPDEGRIEPVLGRAGYLPQGALLFPWKTVLENIALPLRIRGADRADTRDEVRRHLPRFGLDGFENAYPHQLSGGMRQRVALLRAVMTGSPVLVLDEPFGALDTVTRHRLQTWLAGLIEGLDRSMLFVTHDLEEAVALAERIVVLTDRPASILGERRIHLSTDERAQRLGRPFTAAREPLLDLIQQEAMKDHDNPV